MTSDERLVAQAAKEILASDTAISKAVQLALGDDESELKLPCIVVSALFDTEEPGSPLPKKYKLTVELRALKRSDPNSKLPAPNSNLAMDDVFARVPGLLCPVGENRVIIATPTMTGFFSGYRVETQSGADSAQTETNVRSRTFVVYANLIATSRAADSVVAYNATVSSAALILPVQAFVDCAIRAFSDGDFSVLNFSNKGITSISTAFLASIQQALGLPDLYASGNAITNVDAILAYYAAHASTFAATQVLDLSGGTNAIPTKEQIMVLTVAANPGSFGNVTDYYLDGTTVSGARVNLNHSIPLASSSGGWDASGYTIGTSDNPTAAQVATKLGALFAVNPLMHVTVVSSQITVHDFDFSHLWDITPQGLEVLTSPVESQKSDVQVLRFENLWTVTVRST